jgi:hypothetical protein
MHSTITQREQLERDGFCLFKGAVNPEMIQQLREATALEAFKTLGYVNPKFPCSHFWAL